MHRLNQLVFRIDLGSMRNSVRRYSREQKRQGFMGRLLENFQDEMAKNKEMKESLKKFREEAEKLEQSEALKAARQKFDTVEKEATKGSEIFKDSMDTLKTKVKGVLDEATKTELAKKAGKISQEIGRTTSTISEKAQEIGKTEAFKSISEATKAVKQEIDTTEMQGKVYVSPLKLRKRTETSAVQHQKYYEPNTEAMGIELHKDSKFFESWQNFKDNNPYVHKVMDWKLKYDESDNPVVRASRALTNKVSDIVGGLFTKTELSETLTEICKIDNTFDSKKFLKQCETDIIPNILEAMTRGELEILKDWCHQGPYNIFAVPLREALQKGYKIDSKILDIDNVDLVMGKIMEQGPVLIISFTSQQVMCVKDKSGKVVEGDPNKVIRVNYVWVLCRDISEPDPRSAWKLLDISASSSEQLV
ncbi:hypothetical protein WA026_006241 [Henosepilachna vigintioctopunctata]|uniref:Mitochondrial import inner membrane translocase subunit TIM44 n=1 Tax=Henosepilachna vigintioctopunctata TaxID=420089 RepID=A0AAW1TQU6_9CUCU